LRTLEITSDLDTSAKMHRSDYQQQAGIAYQAIQAYLKSKGISNCDAWIIKCISQYPAAEAAEVQAVSDGDFWCVSCRSRRRQSLKALEPPQGLAVLLEPTEIAKFVGGVMLSKRLLFLRPRCIR
jgi:hypothetical protein